MYRTPAKTGVTKPSLFFSFQEIIPIILVFLWASFPLSPLIQFISSLCLIFQILPLFQGLFRHLRLFHIITIICRLNFSPLKRQKYFCICSFHITTSHFDISYFLHNGTGQLLKAQSNTMHFSTLKLYFQSVECSSESQRDVILSYQSSSKTAV